MKKTLRNMMLFATLLGVAPSFVSYAGEVRAVSIETADRSAAELVVNGTEIEFQTTVTMKFEIYSITGQLIRTLTVAPGQFAKIDLSKGFYIIKCEAWTRRVMLK